MSRISPEQKKFLEVKFGSRVSFNKTERMLYGHDIAAIPGLIKLLVGNTVPEAVVQPETEEELVELIHWAKENKIPLTPRGKASSGYGGVLPVKGGVVVDFYRMNKILQKPRILTITVYPSITGIIGRSSLILLRLAKQIPYKSNYNKYFLVF